MLRKKARKNLDILTPFVERRAKVLAINPTCSMMLRREWPELVDPEDRQRAKNVAEATMDPSEFLWSIRKEPRFNTAFKSSPEGKVAYHAPCHLRTQGKGFKGRDLLGKLSGVSTATVMECCGHDGTHAMTVEGFDYSKRVGKTAFADMQHAEATVWSTDCPNPQSRHAARRKAERVADWVADPRRMRHSTHHEARPGNHNATRICLP